MRLVISVFIVISLVCKLAATEREECANFYATAEGYPAGCVSSENDLCVVMDKECESLLCGEQQAVINDTMSNCTIACSEPEPTEVCTCLKYDMKRCPESAGGNTPPPRLEEYQLTRQNHDFLMLGSRQTGVWGGRFPVPGSNLQVVYCVEQGSCNLEVNLCYRGPCGPGQCHFKNSCYFLGNVDPELWGDSYEPNYHVICGSSDATAVVVDTFLEREFVFSLLGESSTQDSWRVWTGGKVPKDTQEGVWMNSTSAESMNPEVYDPSLNAPQNYDQYLVVQIDECGDANFTLVREPVLAALCEIAVEGSTTTTTSTPPATSCEDPCNGTGSYGEDWCCLPGRCNQTCPLNVTGNQNASWVCVLDGDQYHFNTPTPDYSGCSSQWISDIDDNATSQEVIDNLTDNVNSSNVYGSEMTTVLLLTNRSMARLVEEQQNSSAPIAEQLEQRRVATVSTTEIVYRLTNSSFRQQWNSLTPDERMGLGVQVQDTIRDLGFTTTQLARTLWESYNFSVGEGGNFTDVQFVNRSKEESGAVLRFPMSQSGSYIELRDYQGLLGEGDSVGIEAVGNTFTKEQANVSFPQNRTHGVGPKKSYNSEMLSLSLRGPDGPLTNFSSRAIKVVFAHEIAAYGSPRKNEPYNECNRTNFSTRGSAYCAFWNKNAGSDGHGAWDSEGCEIEWSNRTHTTCACDHLSSFAILMDINEYSGFNRVTDVLSKLCSALSMIALLATFLVLYFIPELQGVRTNIGMNLCFCLFFAHFLSLIMLDEDIVCLNDKDAAAPIAGGCVAVGAITHYMFLAAFMWMGIEGFHLYRMMVHVFDSGRDFTLIYMAVAYGVPTVIVGITLAVGFGADNESPYGRDGICWLATPNYVWAFIGPVICVCLVNFGVVILAMRVATSASNQRNDNTVKKIRMWLRGWFSLASLLGVSWLFGFIYLMVDKNLEYVYILLTGLQGVFIFIAKVVMNKQVKRALRRTVARSSMLSRFYSSIASPDSKSNNWSLFGSSPLEVAPGKSKHVAYPASSSKVTEIKWKRTTGLGLTSSTFPWQEPATSRIKQIPLDAERDSAVSSASSASLWDHENLKTLPTLQSTQADVVTGEKEDDTSWAVPPPLPSSPPPPLPRESQVEEEHSLYGRINSIAPRTSEPTEPPHGDEGLRARSVQRSDDSSQLTEFLTDYLETQFYRNQRENSSP